MLDGSLRSRPHEMIVLNLRDSLAQKALNIMQKVSFNLSLLLTTDLDHDRLQIAPPCTSDLYVA